MIIQTAVAIDATTTHYHHSDSCSCSWCCHFPPFPITAPNCATTIMMQPCFTQTAIAATVSLLFLGCHQFVVAFSHCAATASYAITPAPQCHAHCPCIYVLTNYCCCCHCPWLFVGFKQAFLLHYFSCCWCCSIPISIAILVGSHCQLIVLLQEYCHHPSYMIHAQHPCICGFADFCCCHHCAYSLFTSLLWSLLLPCPFPIISSK